MASKGSLVHRALKTNFQFLLYIMKSQPNDIYHRDV